MMMSSALDLAPTPACPVCALCGALLADASRGVLFWNTDLPGQPCASWCDEPDCFGADPARKALAATERTPADAEVFFRTLSARGAERVVASPAWRSHLARPVGSREVRRG